MAEAPEFPNSYKDTLYAGLDAATEKKLGLPAGLLPSIRTVGERSNHSQVSDAGARTVYQITPQTRKLSIDKWGIDPYLSPQNASEVAGMLLKDSLDRNKGDASQAVGEYIGGTDRSNWGPKTRAYISRVTSAQPQAVAPQPALEPDDLPASAQPSTFERLSAQMLPKQAPSQVQAIYKAYQSGQMTHQERSEFEQDVRDGKMMLPRGAKLSANPDTDITPGADGVPVMPPSVIDAYADGRMSEKDKAELESDWKAGRIKLPPGAQLGNSYAAARIPTDGSNPETAPSAGAPVAYVPPPTLGEKAVGAGEAALSTVTGMTGGLAGMWKGAATGLVDEMKARAEGKPTAGILDNAVQQGAADWTYQPRTQTGQEYAQAVNEFAAQNLMPFAGSPELLGAAVDVARPAARAAADTTRSGVSTAAEATRAGAARVSDGTGRMIEPVRQTFNDLLGRDSAPDAETSVTPGTQGSVGSAGTDIARQRVETAKGMPVPIDLTKGQATRDFAQLRFEQESAKDPNAGAALRDRYSEQNQRILQNFDAWVDASGAQAPDLRATGALVDDAIVKQAARDKAAIRVAYKNAEKAGETMAPVDVSPVVKVLNDSVSAESTAPVLKAAKSELVRLGGASLDDAGTLTSKKMTLGDMEQLRKFINKITGIDPTNQKFAADIKGAIDATTDGQGGQLYQQARALRQRYAQNYENRATISKLLSDRKGTTDRAVALEDVFAHSILKGGLDDVRNLRRVLHRSGEQGQQAWRELQGQTVQWLKDEATKGVTTDERGNRVISPAGLERAIRSLDHDGRLDFIFGRRGAQQIRDINDLAKYVHTVPPGSVNTSNTASVLLAALTEAGVTGGLTGLPVPIVSGLKALTQHVKNNRLRARINDALNPSRQIQQEPARPTKPSKRTVH
jgi:hypothetical protein